MVRLADVDSSDLESAVRLGCHAMGAAFDADGDGPLFEASLAPEPVLAFHPWFSEAHVTGRHLVALLLAERTFGVAIDESLIERHQEALWRAFSGPVALPLNREVPDGLPVNFLPHNLREALGGLAALIEHRGSERAYELAMACISAIRDGWAPGTGWHEPAPRPADPMGTTPRSELVAGLGRAVGPLVDLHRVTGEQAALDLAADVAMLLVREHFPEDGAFDQARLGTHVHSITSSLSSLASFAAWTSDDDVVRHVRAFYDHGAATFRDAIGWCPEWIGEPRPDRGESNITADLIETALVLGREVDPDYLDDVELFVRASLLPTQLRDTSFIHPADTLRADLGRRLQGAFGFPAPYGHMPAGSDRLDLNLDIVGGAVRGLCLVADACQRTDEQGRVTLDLLLTRRDQAAVTVDHDAGMLSAMVPAGSSLAIRRSRWADLEPDEPVRWIEDGGYPLLAGPRQGVRVRVSLHAITREVVLHHRTRSIEATLHGSAVRSMQSFGAQLAYFADQP